MKFAKKTQDGLAETNEDQISRKGAKRRGTKITDY